MELLSNIYSWALFSSGIIVSIWGFRRNKNKGYLLVALFFFNPFIALIQEEIRYQIHKEEIEQKIAEGYIPVIEKNIRLPLFESCLVAGLFFTVRSQKIEQIDGGNSE